MPYFGCRVPPELMTYTVLFVIGMGTYVVEDRIVSQLRLQCCPGTDEVIPADMASPSPDDRFHHCTYYPVGHEFDPWGGAEWESPKTRCFFAPMNST